MEMRKHGAVSIGLALMAGALHSSSAYAQSSVTLYGIIDVGV
jgi:predicted porin